MPTLRGACQHSAAVQSAEGPDRWMTVVVTSRASLVFHNRKSAQQYLSHRGERSCGRPRSGEITATTLASGQNPATAVPAWPLAIQSAHGGGIYPSGAGRSACGQGAKLRTSARLS